MICRWGRQGILVGTESQFCKLRRVMVSAGTMMLMHTPLLPSALTIDWLPCS